MCGDCEDRALQQARMQNSRIVDGGLRVTKERKGIPPMLSGAEPLQA